MRQEFHTHIWDLKEQAEFLKRPRDVILVVPACGEIRQATRYHKIPILVLPEECLPRGTHREVKCDICRMINELIIEGQIATVDIWA